MEVIKLEHLSKDYGNNRGIFDFNLSIHSGEMIGFVGTNGSGKTTTIRSILGFIKPSQGRVLVNGKESWKYSDQIIKNIGYVPGEIAFPDLKTGTEFLKSQASFQKLPSLEDAEKLIEELQLDPSANLKRMSKGMKQKTALVAALMNDCPIIILDEPTTGLDPLMRVAFLTIIKREHEKGKTILMSSHLFEEMEETCDRVVLISDGKMIDIADMNEIRERNSHDFKIEFKNEEDFKAFSLMSYPILRIQEEYKQVTIRISGQQINQLMRDLSKYDVEFVSEVKYSLERHFKEKMLKKEEM